MCAVMVGDNSKQSEQASLVSSGTTTPRRRLLQISALPPPWRVLPGVQY